MKLQTRYSCFCGNDGCYAAQLRKSYDKSGTREVKPVNPVSDYMGRFTDMEVQWMNHTGFVVSDMERSLAFYRDLLGLSIERDQVLEGDFISEVVGHPDARLHIVHLGVGDQRHSVELIQYLNPVGDAVALPQRHQVRASHRGIIVDDLDAFLRRPERQGGTVREPAGDAAQPGVSGGQQGLLHGGPRRELAGTAGAGAGATRRNLGVTARAARGSVAWGSITSRGPTFANRQNHDYQDSRIGRIETIGDRALPIRIILES